MRTAPPTGRAPGPGAPLPRAPALGHLRPRAAPRPANFGAAHTARPGPSRPQPPRPAPRARPGPAGSALRGAERDLEWDTRGAEPGARFPPRRRVACSRCPVPIATPGPRAQLGRGAGPARALGPPGGGLGGPPYLLASPLAAALWPAPGRLRAPPPRPPPPPPRSLVPAASPAAPRDRRWPVLSARDPAVGSPAAQRYPHLTLGDPAPATRAEPREEGTRAPGPLHPAPGAARPGPRMLAALGGLARPGTLRSTFPSAWGRPLPAQLRASGAGATGLPISGCDPTLRVPTRGGGQRGSSASEEKVRFTFPDSQWNTSRFSSLPPARRRS